LCKVLHFVQDDSAKNLTINGSLLAIMKRTALLTSCLLLLTLTDLNADNISVLGSKPRWSVLEHYQETITHDEFADLINDVYCTHGFAPDLVEINEKTARILINRKAQKFFTLRFAENEDRRKPVPRLWRSAKSLPPTGEEKPLSSLKIGLDPGHLGGKWAKMEERWFQVGNSPPV